MSHHIRRYVLPFTAIVGQERLKKALILNAINPALCGVLIRGERGTAKSTAVRALAEVLPDIEVVDGCPFNCHPTDPSLQCDECNRRFEAGEELPRRRRKTPVVELPLGATEDRIIGTIDIEKVLKEGVRALQPGLLAAANRGFLYIDEINLLDDHLVDVLLDAAAMGVNVIEREGVSFSHPARFVLVGTMNPQEGDLRPQILDRIGLQVDVETIDDPQQRMQIIRTVEEFQRDPAAFLRRHKDAQLKLRQRITNARRILNEVTVSDEMLRFAAQICIEAGVEGHRADILITRCAKTIAAFNARKSVTKDDIKQAAELVLPHRLRTDPLQPEETEQQRLQQAIEAAEHQQEDRQKQDNDEENGGDNNRSPPTEHDHPSAGKSAKAQERVFEACAVAAPNLEVRADRRVRFGRGRRAKTLAHFSGRYVRFRIPPPRCHSLDVAYDATLRAAVCRKRSPHPDTEDIRVKVRQRRRSTSILILVDSSASMGAQNRMRLAKGLCLALLEDAYQKRDRVAFAAFSGSSARTLLPFSNSKSLARQRLNTLPTGGRTPLSSGLLLAYRLFKQELTKNRETIPVLVLVSDGCANVAVREGGSPRQEVLQLARRLRQLGVRVFVFDTSGGLLSIGLCSAIAEESGGVYYRVGDINCVASGESAEIFSSFASLIRESAASFTGQ